MGQGLPSKQTVNAVGGREQARSVRAGTRLWTLDATRTVRTTVTGVTVAKARDAVDVVTSHTAFTVSANVGFLAELAGVIGARFTPRPRGLASHLTVVDNWAARGTFRPEQHPLHPVESGRVEVVDVRPRRAEGKPFTFYGFCLDPYPTFLVNGHLARQAW
ncbi:hypothetical protein ABT097_13225 [Streptomyces sp. NPDC002225]|uniref:hypothetical protein n=1 Tax=Streptomyces sp. NPDC002225 TaxID=3154413 RepID=UPI003322C920